jgi:hypothetical protein
MRSIKSGLLGVAVAGLLGAFAVVGCSASGDTGDIGGPATDNDPTEPGAVLPGASDEEDDPPAKDGGKKDAGKDSGKKDAAKDAGPPPPAEGTVCKTPNEIFKRTCGNCGKQEAVCLADTSGTAGTVSPYGECTNQVVNGCSPGSTEDIPCGNCGTMKRTCNNYCAWSNATCTGQPAQSCTPGSVELLSAGCNANEYRQKSCKATCTWDNVSLTCSAPPTFVLVPPTAGGVNSTIAVFSSTKTTARMPSYGTCPLTAAISTTITPYTYIEVRNTNPKAVTVSLYNSQATGGPIIDTVMAAYDGVAIPTTEAARKACKGSMGDYGTSALTGDADFASLDGTKAITIPANSSVQVYFASYYAYDASTPGESTGMIKLNVKTETVAP